MNTNAPPVAPTKGRRGFAIMDPAKQRAIASAGGISAKQNPKVHRFTSEEASAAAKLAHQLGTAHKFTSEEARIAGRKGGEARAATMLARRLRAESVGT